MPILFAENMRAAFAVQKLLLFFQQKISFGYKVMKYLTSWPLNDFVKVVICGKYKNLNKITKI